MTTFVREDWTLFRSLGTLSQRAGVAPGRIPSLVAKELVDNALDIAGSANAALRKNGFIISDNGAGIPGDDDEIASLFSIGRPLVSSKLLRLPTRGALGNGLRVAAGAVLASGGDLIVSTRGRRLHLKPCDDGTTAVRRLGDFDEPGTQVQVMLGDSLQVDHRTLEWARDAIRMATGESYKGKTSPWWYDSDAFFELLQAAGERPVRDLIADMDGCSGAKAGKIAAPFLGRSCASMSREEAEALLLSARENAKKVQPGRLGYVGAGAEWLPGAYARVDSGMMLHAARGEQAAMIPYVVEAWVALGDGDTTMLACVNKTPITAQINAYESKKELVLYGAGLAHAVADLGRSRVRRIVLNVTTPYMPITSDGKAPDFGRIAPAIAEAIGRSLRSAKRGSRAMAERPATQKEIVFKNMQAAIAHASGGGQYRYQQRQLFYALRPYLLDATGQAPSMGTVAAYITDWENEYGEAPGMYRDARGIVYHPHLRQEIPLGTLSVEAYTRPTWTFNKVLYIEKEGFFPLLKDEQWPERHDCALLTSKGQATRAVKDLIDLLGETSEEITFYCVHDADAYGTLIYHALQEATRSRPERRVHIVNLGLEPWEGLEMGLQTEPVTSDKKRHPVGDYVPAEWGEWLQGRRIELNAMTTGQFIEWLDLKMAEHGTGKVMPPAPVIGSELASNVAKELRSRLAGKILAEAGIDKQVSMAMSHLHRGALRVARRHAGDRVSDSLADYPAQSWREPLRALASEVVDDYESDGLSKAR